MPETPTEPPAVTHVPPDEPDGREPAPTRRVQRRNPRRARRLLLWLGLGAVAVLALYVGGANYFLRSPELQAKLFKHPEKLRVTWERGWTLWPGRVHLEGVEIRGQNRRLQWWARLDRTSVAVDLPRLAFRTFRARRVSGGGLQFHLRQRLAEGEIAPRGPDGSVLTPEIPGLDNPPDPPPESLTRRPPGPRPPGWRIRLEGIELDELRELWVDRYRLAGGGRVAGDLEFQVRGEMSVDNARLEIEQGKLLEGTDELLQQADLVLDLTFDPFRPKEEKGLAFLSFASGRLQIDTRTDSVGFLDPWLDHVPGLALDGGGALTADVGFDHGQPTPGSRLELVPDGLDVEYHQFRATGAGRLDVEITEERRTRMTASFERFALSIRRDGEKGESGERTEMTETRLEGNGFVLTAEAGELRLDQVPPPPTVEIRLSDLEIPDITVFNGLIPAEAGLRLTGGRGTFAAQAVLDAAVRTGRGEVTLTAEGLAARMEPSESLGIDARGGLRVHVRVPHFDLAERTLETADGELGLRDFELTGSAGALSWRADVDRLDFELDPEGFRRRTVHATRVAGQGFAIEIDQGESPGGTPPRPRRRAAPRGGWHLLLDDLDLTRIRELRWNDYRLQGDTRLGAAVDWQLGGTLSASRLHVEIADAKLLERRPNNRTATLLPRLEARADLSCQEMLPGVAGSSIPAHLSGTLHIETRSDSLKLINRFLSRIPELALDGRGDLTLDLKLRRGHLEPGTRMTSVGELDLAFLDYQARGTGRVTGKVEAASGGKTAQTVLHADLDRFDLSWRDGPQRYVQGEDLQLHVTGPALYLGAPPEMDPLQVEIDLPESEVPDLTVYNSILPAGAGLRITSGRGTLTAHARYDTRTGNGSAELILRAVGLGARYGTTDLTGDFQLTTRVPRLRLAKRTFDLDRTRLDIRRAVVAGEPTETGWWMVVELPESKLDLGSEPRLDARIKASMRDSSPLTAYLESKKRLLKWIDGALTLEDVDLEAELDARPGHYRVRGAKITGHRLEILGEVRLAEERHDGLFHLKAGPLSVGFEMMGGKKDLKLLHSRRWFEDRRRAW